MKTLSSLDGCVSLNQFLFKWKTDCESSQTYYYWSILINLIKIDTKEKI